MTIYDYSTAGGKNMIMEYICGLSESEQLELLDIRSEIEKSGMDAFEKLDVKHLRKKLWEIRSKQNRLLYVIKDRDSVYFLHICKKEKNKTKQQDMDVAMKRAKDAGLM